MLSKNRTEISTYYATILGKLYLIYKIKKMKNNLRILGFSLLTLILFSCTDADDKANDAARNQENCLTANLQNGVIAFYPFSNGSINDFSGNNYHLTNTTSASPGSDRAGNTNCAFHFEAANGDFLHYTNPTFVDNFQTLPFSISLWYKHTSIAPPGLYQLLIGRDYNPHCPDTYGQWSVGLYDSFKPVFGINQYSLWWDIRSDVLASEWRHLVVTCTGTDLKLYLNGALTPETPGTGCSTNIPTINSGDLFLGKEFNGLLDDVIIYNRVLTQNEITALNGLTPCCQ